MISAIVSLYAGIRLRIVEELKKYYIKVEYRSLEGIWDCERLMGPDGAAFLPPVPEIW